MKFNQIKEKLPHHTNLAHYINSLISDFDYSECLKQEQYIIQGDDIQGISEGFDFIFARGVDRDSILRLLALFSLTQSGLKKSVFQELYSQYINWYGVEEMVTLLNLEEMKLFKVKEGKYNWNSIKNNFHLINEDVQLTNPVDYSYTYNGYSPLSVRILDYCMKFNGLASIESKLKLVTDKYKYPYNERELFEERGGTEKKKIILVFFIGGITYAEMSAIRYLNKLYPDKLFVIGTTEIINYKKWITQIRRNI